MQVVKRLTSLDPAAIDGLAKLLASCFDLDDELYAALFGDAPDPLPLITLYFRSRGYESVRDDEVYVVEAAGLIVAAAIVVPPGPRRQREATPYSDELKRETPPDVTEKQKIFHEVVDELESEAFGDDTYYLSFLGVAPWARGKGLAGALLKHVVDRARADGRLVTVTTTTEGNIPMYEKFGFTGIQSAEVTLGRSRLDIWAMDNAASEGHL
ncbi:acyl-CoA N-acyltransferase [Cutaneotrichosporon oleaginosum]|uniref:Acyl-CoA N-acyltransferase n=1 Tax=Cutaneotrichosporon oleaginosum TaxID=879819 RepID=A0A0J0XU15_9TREE|nr:acyl-CoA N-acyltransferase [Cutaneotrichosporon oleaginosum]KLT44578.1 acyl-CoA N-acyltransferase [Cutaneotrichosporon oleaginosum]TXT13908.1 hypothetical protein COLE_00101 [Cutaneotrichosporon oleaginosum]